MKTISILGCGWLGMPLAQSLINDGYTVKGSTTDPGKTEILRGMGIKPFLISAEPRFDHNKAEDFFKTDLLVINIPPPRRDDVESYHPEQISCIAEALKRYGVKYVIFISSTSVYPNVNREVTEEDDLVPGKASGKALKKAETLLLNSTEFQTTVIRLSGLIGYDRNPRNFLKRRKPRARGDAPVNLIHRDDCIEIIKEVIRQGITGEILNASSDKNPLRSEFYKSQAGDTGINMDSFFSDRTPEYKIVNNRKLKDTLGYKFIYPDPLKIDR